MYAVNFKQVGENISQAMKIKGMTQKQLADQLGVSKQVMSKIINGKKAINVEELSKIAFILGSSTDMLLSSKNNSQEYKYAPMYMGIINDEKARKNVELLREAIDQIHLLEDLIDE
ncbi:MAG: helix-turn-helix domain-containing protein [Bacilli bacterium]|jgi:transcriptional regulator with XRE-family HTH domain